MDKCALENIRVWFVILQMSAIAVTYTLLNLMEKCPIERGFVHLDERSGTMYV